MDAVELYDDELASVISGGGLRHGEKAQQRRGEGSQQFAMDVLFGESGIGPFEGLTRAREIAVTPRRLGIAPGVAVHQMHRRRLLD